MNFSKRKIANFRKWNEDRRIRLNVNAYYLSMYSAKGKKNPRKIYFWHKNTLHLPVIFGQN